MIKKIILLFIIITVTSCSSVKKVGNPVGTCPPQEERTLLNILCQEGK